MAKIPTMDEMAEQLTKNAMDNVLCDGKSLREWVKIIVSRDAISREEAKHFLYERLDELNNDELYDIFSTIIDEMYNELPPIQPKAKTDVLDKIRAEIAEIPKKYPMTMDYENGLKEALTIIDKYKAESEVRNEDSNWYSWGTDKEVVRRE